MLFYWTKEEGFLLCVLLYLFYIVCLISIFLSAWSFFYLIYFSVFYRVRKLVSNG